MNELSAEMTEAEVGPVVVWLGSLGSTAAMWDPQVDAFEDRCRCVLIDHPGHGASPAGPGPYSISGLADDVVAALDRLDIERAHVAGLSIGGMIAMSLAARHADRIDRLALLCTSANLGPPDGWLERAATVRADGAAAVAPTVVGRWFTPAYAEANTDEVDQMVAMISSVDPEGYAACCEAIAAMDLRPELPGIDAPTIVIAGTDDPSTPPEHGEAIAALIPGARFETVVAAHLSSWERADDVNALLAPHFLDEVPDGARRD